MSVGCFPQCTLERKSIRPPKAQKAQMQEGSQLCMLISLNMVVSRFPPKALLNHLGHSLKSPSDCFHQLLFTCSLPSPMLPLSLSDTPAMRPGTGLWCDSQSGLPWPSGHQPSAQAWWGALGHESRIWSVISFALNWVVR